MSTPGELKFKKADAFLLAGLLLAAAAFFAASFFIRGSGAYVLLRTEDKEERYALSEDRDVKIHTAYGENVLRISGGEAYMLLSDCPGGDCLRMGSIGQSGGAIVCVPHHLSITVTGGDVDAVAR